MKSTYLSLNSRLPLFILVIVFLLPVKEINAQFAYGADVGWLSQMEYYGYIFKDNAGNQKDCLDILKEKGINALRFRVWVNPAGNFNNKKDVVYMAKRAKSKGFDVMINFHMSDSWADPAKQTKPASWLTHSSSQLQTDIYNHVYNVLDTLKSIGITPKWVQIGNETNNGMLWEEGKASSNMSNFAAFVASGYNAVKAVDNTIQVIVHLSNGHENSLYRWLFDGLKNNGAKWDIIGMSVYPYWAGISWDVANNLALTNMLDLISRYSTKVMVCEAGYPYNQAVEAKKYLTDLIIKTKSVGGLGVFYWEPQCYNWQNYSLGAWDPVTKQPTVAMDAFLEANPVSVDESETISDFEFKIFPNPFNPSTTIEYKISEASNVSVVIFDLLGREVSKLVDGFSNPGSYSVKWQAENIPGGVYFCRLISQRYIETRKIVLMK